MKKLQTVLAASALAVVAAQASAATHTISGTGFLTAQPGTPAYINTVYTWEGEGTLVGDILNYDYTQTFTGGAGVTEVEFSGFVDTTTGTGEQTVGTCTFVSGFVSLCLAQFDALFGTTSPFASDTFGFDGAGAFTWASSAVIDPGPGPADSFQSITATPNAVPVPAAAWLFGSALVGLAGIGRKRK